MATSVPICIVFYLEFLDSEEFLESDIQTSPHSDTAAAK